MCYCHITACNFTSLIVEKKPSYFSQPTRHQWQFQNIIFPASLQSSAQMYHNPVYWIFFIISFAFVPLSSGIPPTVLSADIDFVIWLKHSSSPPQWIVSPRGWIMSAWYIMCVGRCEYRCCDCMSLCGLRAPPVHGFMNILLWTQYPCSDAQMDAGCERQLIWVSKDERLH